jgi:2'-5' RNA ligase
VRLFVALNLPDRTRHALWDAISPLRDLDLPVSWVRPEGIHVTLKFLGEVEESRQGELTTALGAAAAGVRPLPLVLGGFGAFPAIARPRVLWVGIEPEPALELLQHGVERQFAPLGFPTEARTFHPHVTVGRARKDARPAAFAGLESRLERLSFAETVMVESVDLMCSTLQRGGAVYQVAHRERLS